MKVILIRVIVRKKVINILRQFFFLQNAMLLWDGGSKLYGKKSICL